MVTVSCDVRAADGCLVTSLTGLLDRAAVPDVRLDLLKCLAEQPRALIVDLSGLVVGYAPALSVFTAVSGQAARWPGTPVLFCAPPPELYGAAGGLYRRALVFPAVAAAQDHLATSTRTLDTVTDELLPVRGAARRGRDVVTDTCLRWELPGLVGPASLICSELIANVCDHVGTMMTLKVTGTPRYLLLSVRDGATAPPVPEPAAGPMRGHGLQIVSAVAHAWGWIPANQGKVVWASLRRNER
jgi:anti-anti-sigma regulatory factor